MFIARGHPNYLAPLGAKPGSGTSALGAARESRSSGAQEQRMSRQAINISPLQGEAAGTNLLHFEVESTNDKCERIWKISLALI
jgi:hypothetical protein